MNLAIAILLRLVILFGVYTDVALGAAATTPPGSLDYSVVRAISSDRVLPDTFPLPGVHGGAVQIRASRGEFEAASFLVRAKDGANYDVKAIASDLTTTDAKSRISAENLDIRIVKTWYQGISAWDDISKSTPNDFRQVLVPELLLKDDELVQVDARGSRNLVRIDKDGKSEYIWANPPRLASAEQVLPTVSEFPVRDSRDLQPFRASGGVTKQLWLTLHVPLDAAPGRYRGQISLDSGGDTLAVVPLDVEVHAFELAESPLTYSIYYRAQLDPAKASIGSEFRTREQMQRELKDLRDHGVANPTMYQGTGNETLLREALALRKEVGISHGPLFFLGIQTTESFLGNLDTAADGNLKRLLPMVSNLARANGFGDMYLYGRDEAKGPELARQRRVWRVVHDLGAKVFVAGSTGAHELVGDLLDTQVNYGKPDFAQAEKWHQDGKRIYSYANPQSGPENPYLFRLNYGVMLWANDYDGAMPYAYQHCMGACWNDVDDPVYRDHNMTYPTADGVIPTLAWEGFREAIDDVRYLGTLEEALQSSGNGRKVAATLARAFLQQLRRDLRAEAARGGKYNQNLQVDLDDVRNQVVSHINQVRTSSE